MASTTVELHGITETARALGCAPYEISSLFSRKILDESRLIHVANRRLIPDDYLPEVERVLRDRGKIATI